jgi:glutamate synthase (NADPH/NADH) large chain
VAEHARETQSRFADQLLHDWSLERGKFWHVVPTEMLARLPHPMADAAAVEAANRA